MSVADHLSTGGQAIFTNCPDGLDALVIADLAQALGQGGGAGRSPACRPRRRSARRRSRHALAFFAPEIEVLSLPGLGLPAL